MSNLADKHKENVNHLLIWKASQIAHTPIKYKGISWSEKVIYLWHVYQRTFYVQDAGP